MLNTTCVSRLSTPRIRLRLDEVQAADRALTSPQSRILTAFRGSSSALVLPAKRQESVSASVYELPGRKPGEKSKSTARSLATWRFRIQNQNLVPEGHKGREESRV